MYKIYYTGLADSKSIEIDGQTYEFKRLEPIIMNKSEIKQFEFKRNFSVTKLKGVEEDGRTETLKCNSGERPADPTENIKRGRSN